MDVRICLYPSTMVGMTSKQKLTEKVERQHAAALARQRQRASRRPSATQRYTNELGIALCRAMLRSVASHRDPQQPGST